MQETFDRGVEVDRCNAGHGVFFDRGEVERFVGADPGLDRKLLAAANRQATRSSHSCAGCQRSMVVFQSATVAAHLCQYCGGAFIEGQYLPQLGTLATLPRGGPALEPRRPLGGGRIETGAMGVAAHDVGIVGHIAAEAAIEGAWVAGEVIADGGVGDALEVAADLGGGALEVAGEVGGTVLEALGELIGGLFSGL